MATLILKPTENCNARCAYCDVVHKPHRTGATMPLDLLEKVFIRCDEFLGERPDESLDVIWHGGEPLLLGPAYFEKALEFQNRRCGGTRGRIHHSIQSNLTLLDREIARALKALGMDSVGTSYDPLPGIRGLGSRRDWQEYNRRFMRGLEVLQSEGMSWGVIYVVTSQSLACPLDLFHFLTNLRPDGAVRFNPVQIYGRDADGLAITQDQFCDFLGAILPTWWQRREQYPGVEPLRSLELNIVQGQRRLCCCESGQCALSHLDIGPNGAVSQCGRSADWKLLDYGSIKDKSIAEIFDDPQRHELMRRDETLRDSACKGCRLWEICHGGCPLDGWAATGSLMDRPSGCHWQKRFIEKHFEPLVGRRFGDKVADPQTAKSVAQSGVESSPPAPRHRQEACGTGWINAIGGLGDMLMLSGVLKQVVDADPARRFNLIKRTTYSPFFQGHPAIEAIGHPPPGAEILHTTYWSHKDYAKPSQRAYQILAQMFGLPAPAPELLYIPGEIAEDPLLAGVVPWKPRNVLICPASSSPRKEMSIEIWEDIVGRLARAGVGVVQAGRRAERYVRGAYSLLGLTTPRQAIGLLGRFDLVVTSDNFFMHAARLRGRKAVVLWGPTDHRFYGYPEHCHLQAATCPQFGQACIGPAQSMAYDRPCPNDRSHCIDQIGAERIFQAIAEEMGM